MTLYLTEVEDARAFGCVPTDEAGRVSAFLEKMDSPVTNRVNAGFYTERHVGHADPGAPLRHEPHRCGYL